MTMTFIKIEHALEQFQLDPRSRPPFDEVFIYQSQLVNAISLTLFGRILYLVVVFTIINTIKGEILFIHFYLFLFFSCILFIKKVYDGANRVAMFCTSNYNLFYNNCCFIHESIQVDQIKTTICYNTLFKPIFSEF